MTRRRLIKYRWNRIAPFALAIGYSLAWLLLAVAQVARGVSPWRFFVWSGLAEWAGLLLVTSLVGWWVRRPRDASRQILSADGDRLFPAVQALLTVTVALWLGWVTIDFSFDGMGAGLALFGFAGRTCACPSALMLLGASILMAWQSSAGWRVRWQSLAITMGLLFTTSISWVRVDASSEAPWWDRQLALALTSGMMSLMTRFAFPRVLPAQSDWLVRGRQASCVCTVIALLLASSTAITWKWTAR